MCSVNSRRTNPAAIFSSAAFVSLLATAEFFALSTASSAEIACRQRVMRIFGTRKLAA